MKNFVTPLCKKCRFGIRFETQHDKVSQILEKCPWESIYHLFSSFWEKLISKISPVLLDEILEMFLNRLSAEGKHPIEDWENLLLPNQMQLFEKRKSSSQFFVPFLQSKLNLKHFEKKKMIAIANVFPKLQTVKILVRALFKNRRFRKRFDSQHVKVSQILAKSPSAHFPHVFPSIWGKLIWKMSPLVFGEILGLFLDTLPAGVKYPVEYYGNLWLHFKCNYLKNENLFLNFWFNFWNLH